ncbi:phosphate/phosphite/phosphonate ABC transporter substrate-binding protein [Aquimonas voraii]|uniref:ABC transporter, phosphonate, substrate-binding protein n=1 Tax=Aquimonas voraii TaxID=265719 RepID=A0A1G6SA58_9GAMM|nr:PhnD/SsuA/transferrin family substrate-binding protein [Aquimonas voraii]SDD13729.1 ABC transporter, phosphonate, substrate-binding protein [Aquimonas voraii]
MAVQGGRRAWLQALFALLITMVSAPVLADEFKVALEPSFPPDRNQQIYQPLLDYLASETGHRFVAVTARNYNFHWRDIRQSSGIDFAFEEAHFTDYRAQRQGFRPLARLAEKTAYALVALPELAEGGMDALVGRRLVSMTSPSLGYALLFEIFTNPIAQPDIRSEAASWRDGVEMIFGGEADAAMVPRFIADMYPNLQIMSTTRDFPGMAFSAAPSVPEDVVVAVREALLKLHQNPDAYQALLEIGSTRFEPASAADYRGHQEMLKGFFGYQ